jgi:hypothetical protein
LRIVDVRTKKLDAGATGDQLLPPLEALNWDLVLRVQQSYPQDEITFPAVFSQENIAEELDCIMDTGCSSGYLLAPRCWRIPFRVHSNPYRIRLADGTGAALDSAVAGQLRIGSQTRTVELRIISGEYPRPALLFGRQLINAFKLTTIGANRVCMDEQILFDREFVGRVAERYSGEDPEYLTEGFVILPQDIRPEDRVSFPISSAERLAIRRRLSTLTERGECPLPFTTGATIRLRRLRPDELRDTSEQEFCFEVDTGLSRAQLQAGSRYAVKSYRALQPEMKTEYRRLVEEYVSTGWWTPTTSSQQDQTPLANVFGISQQGKLRLVADFRMFNKDHPSSTVLPSLHLNLINIGIHKTEQLVIGDCRSAFMRVRLKHPLLIHTGVGDFLTHRMSFGLSFGPEGLRQSAGKLWEEFRCFSTLENGIGSLYADDWFLGGKQELLLPEAAKLLALLGACGFDCIRKKFQIVEKDSPPASLYGVLIHLQEGATVFDCNRGQRLTECRELLGKPMTKKSVFALAGKLAYDSMRLHAEARLVSDLLRSVVGATFAKESFAETLDWANKPDTDRRLFEGLLAWVETLLEERCEHRITASTTLRLRFQSDASIFGFGVCGYIGNDPIYQTAGAWNKTEANYSTNRLEAIALQHALRAASLLVEHLHRTTFGKTSEVNLLIETDSSTALAWATKGPGKVPTSSMELRMIERLAEAMDAEITLLRKLCNEFTIVHLPGAENTTADRLSRLLYRPLAGKETIGTLQRIRQTRPKSGENVAMIRESASTIERIAESSFDITDTIDMFTLMRKCLRAWRASNARPVPAGGESNEHEAFLEVLQADLPLEARKRQIHRWDGTIRDLEVIPKNHPWVSDRIIRFFHRLNGHRGIDYTMADVYNTGNFWIPGVRRATRRVVQSCLICAKKNASLATHKVLAPKVEPRDPSLPVFSRVAIDHVHTKPIALSVLCIDTGFLQIVECHDLSTESAIRALSIVSNRYCAQFIKVHADNFKSLISTKLTQGLKRLGHLNVEVTHSAVNCSEMNPVERAHKELWQVLRVRKFTSRINQVRDNSGAVLEAVCAILNSRPIGYHMATSNSEVTIITPALLAMGATFHPYHPGLVEIRKYFYEYVFDQMRRRFGGKETRQQSIFVGQNVMVKTDTPDKYAFPAEIGKVVEITPRGKIFVRRSGKTAEVGASHLVPLSEIFQSSADPESALGGVS